MKKKQKTYIQLHIQPSSGDEGVPPSWHGLWRFSARGLQIRHPMLILYFRLAESKCEREAGRVVRTSEYQQGRQRVPMLGAETDGDVET